MLKSAPEQTVAFEALRAAAQSSERVAGYTHRHYKYPARFSPMFVNAAIEQFSQPGDLVLDPYMGGGTSIVEALAKGRHVVGCDINSLAYFVTAAKVQKLSPRETKALNQWATGVVPRISFRDKAMELADMICEKRTKNLHLPHARTIKKFIGLALVSLQDLPTAKSKRLARCALLNAAQQALNGRKTPMALSQFRGRLTNTLLDMLEGSAELAAARNANEVATESTLIQDSSERLLEHEPFRSGKRADLVVTSPPYPGVHVLYHRWQVDGRKETPAPYWIANCLDGQGSAYYNFGGRFQRNHNNYFAASLRTLLAIRSVMRKGATIIQLIAFSDPAAHLPRYMKNMEEAGFVELGPESGEAKPHISRTVPWRSWHATMKGNIAASHEVVLVHKAI